jgi:hypothetical protein
MRTTRLTLTLCAAICSATLLFLGTANADEAKTKKTKAQQLGRTVVARNLDNPTGLAIQPETGHVFIASRDGIRRLVPGEGRPRMEVTGFPTDIYGKGPKYNIGPLGLAFLGKNRLVVGDGSRPDGEELIRIYEVGDQAPRRPRQENSAAITLGPVTPSEQTRMGEGNFYGVAINDSAIFFSSNGDDTKGWVGKIDLTSGSPSKIELAIATKVAVGVDAPVPLTFSPQGDLVVGQMGEINIPGDSLLTMYDPQTGQLKRNLKTGLNDIIGLAYSPQTGHLYGLDFSWLDESKGGLFRLDIVGDEVKPKKIIGLNKPTSLAFDADGKLYISVFGNVDQEAEENRAGRVIVLNAGL